MIAVLHWRMVACFALLAAVPFLLTTIPPLTDIPGHIGRFSVQTASPGDALLRFYGFHWRLTLNLASDVLVELLHSMAGIVPLVWLLCALTPLLTVVGIAAIARQLNPRGADSLPWALLFVFNFAFLYGFLNFTLTLALGLIAVAAWLGLQSRPWRRALLFIGVTPMLLIGHGVAGFVMLVLIVGHGVGEALRDRPMRRRRETRAALIRLWPPLVAGATTVLVWRLTGARGGGPTAWILDRKLDALVTMLRDQNMVFDVGSVVCALFVTIVGFRSGARLRGGAAGMVIGLTALFVITPSLISGSNRIDTRLAPVIALLALALLDWSQVERSRRRAVLLTGFALLAARFMVTTISFARYDRRYAMELQALPHIPVGSRVLNLARVDCGTQGWRSQRLEHLGSFATTTRGSWVNAQWSVDGLQLLDVKYRPSPDYVSDPSQLIWPAHCIDRSQPFGVREHHTLLESMPRLPLARVEYLWLIGERLPAGYRDPRLHRVWNDDISELYRVQ
ncbi:hypothetical protein [Sphingomonas sp. PAMC 26605]|uniref:hypothetical protein n=1 Tax=Sphingomonas sp. PAMC 26605 TaxID=1112214 RepID=UPI00026CA770|nr:hypothetical protein [Sphingomonas sp. PAMC 26605]